MSNEIQLPESREQAKRALANAVFNKFDDMDWQCFAGVECKNPLICYLGDYAAIIEDGMVFFISVDEDGHVTQSREWDLVGELGFQVTLKGK